MSLHKHKNKLDPSGQASVEYLLVLGAVFIGFAGAASVFAHQMDRYLSVLFDLLALPF